MFHEVLHALFALPQLYGDSLAARNVALCVQFNPCNRAKDKRIS